MSDLVVLCYHAVSDDWSADLSVTPAALEAQLGLLVSRGYRGATFSNAISGAAPGPTVVVTFDDAYRSVLTRAAPVLDALGLPATVFAPTDFIGRPEPMSWPGIDQWRSTAHDHELEPLSWPQLEELIGRGWEVGSHSCSHPHLTQLDDDALAHELRSSRERCEQELARPCTSLAYPYGDADARVVAAAATSGYSAACLLPSRFAAPRALEWPRVGVYHGDSLTAFRAKVARPVRRLRATALWSALDAARSARRAS